MPKKKDIPITAIGEGEIIDFILGEYHIKIDSKQGNGNRCNYILTISAGKTQAIIHLTQKEYSIFSQFSENIGSPVYIDKSSIPTLNGLRKKLPADFIKNKRGEGYYIGVLSKINFDVDVDVGVSDASVSAMIDEALSYTPQSSPVDTDRKPPSKKSKDYKEAIDGIGAKFIDILEEHPGEVFSLEDILSILEIKVDNLEGKKLGIISAIEKYNSNNPDRKIQKTEKGWLLPKQKEKKSLADEFDIGNFAKK